MNAPRVRTSSAAEYFEIQALARGLGKFLLVGGVLGVFFAATFPFDFSLPAQASWDWQWNPYDPNLTDRTENILFFMPFGFALASMIAPTRLYRRTMQLVLSLVLGFLLTSLVESLQQYVSFRDPSLADLWCNTLGGVLGAVVYILIGDRVLRTAAGMLLRLRAAANPIVLGILLLLYAAGQLSAPLLLRNPGDMSGWDHMMWLWLGSNAAGNVPWNGNLWQVTLADRAATPEEALQLARGAEPGTIFGESLVGDYRTIGEAPYADQSKHLSALNFIQKQIEKTQTTAPSAVTAQQTLRSESPIAPAILRIARNSQLTIAMTLATWAQDERGPAVVLTIAGDDRVNIVIGQEYTDLVMRLRTAVRGAPQLHLRNVFTDNDKHQITITQKEAQTILYVDGHEHGRVEVTPEAKVIWRLYPRGGFRMWINTYGFRSYAAMYRLLVFIPFAAMLGAMLAMVNWTLRTKRIAGIGTIVGMSIALEIILGTQSASGFQTRNLVISLAIGLLSLGGLAWWRRRSVMKRQVQF